MLRSLLRTFAFLATLLGVWLVANPAWAYVSHAAPQCDGRGAVTFAPAPLLQDPTTSLDVDERHELEACLGVMSGEDTHVQQGRGPVARSAPGQTPFTLPAAMWLAPARADAATFACDDEPGASPGFRTRIPRPPR